MAAIDYLLCQQIHEADLQLLKEIQWVGRKAFSESGRVNQVFL